MYKHTHMWFRWLEWQYDASYGEDTWDCVYFRLSGINPNLEHIRGWCNLRSAARNV